VSHDCDLCCQTCYCDGDDSPLPEPELCVHECKDTDAERVPKAKGAPIVWPKVERKSVWNKRKGRAE
jgi:hypothetical protein